MYGDNIIPSILFLFLDKTTKKYDFDYIISTNRKRNKGKGC